MATTHRKPAFELYVEGALPIGLIFARFLPSIAHTWSEYREHQHLELQIDFKRKAIRGYTELSLHCPKKMEHVMLHCQQVSLLGVRIDDVPRQFKCANYCQQMVEHPNSEVCDGGTFQLLWRASQETSDEYDLAVNVPDDFSAIKTEDWVPRRLVLRIDFELVDPHGGLYFVLPQERAHPNRREHCYTLSELGAARTWMPCVDYPSARCSWTIALTVPESMVAVAVGELESRDYLDQQSKVRYQYRLSVPTAAHQILFAVGPFESIHDTPPVQLQQLQLQQQQAQQQQQSQQDQQAVHNQPDAQHDPHRPKAAGVASPPWRSGVLSTSFCLPGRVSLMTHTCKDTLSRGLEFLEQHLKLRFPYKSLKIVFVEAHYDKLIVGAGLIIASTHLLHSSRIIDQHTKTKHVFWTGLAKLWTASQLVLRSWYDTWIESGMTSYLASLVYRHVYGSNMFKEWVWSTMARTMEAQLQRGAKVALYETNFTAPHELFRKPMLDKSALVFHLLEKRMTQEGLRKVLSAVLLPPSNTTTPPSILKTEAFIKLCSKTTGEALKPFAENWIYTDTCPVVSSGIAYNRRKNSMLVAFKQDTSKACYVSDFLRIRVYQTDGKVFETRHLVPHRGPQNGESSQVFDITLVNDSANTVRQPSQRRQQMDPELAANGVLQASPCSWIRIDPDLEWIRKLQVKLPLFMWLNQLQKDRDVFAQWEALDGILSTRMDQIRLSNEELGVVKTLREALGRKDWYYGVRVSVARALGSLASSGVSGAGIALFEYFKAKYYIESAAQWRPNDFDDVAEYFVKKAVVESIASIKDKDTGLTSRESLDFVLEILRSTNDNSRNKYEDNYYIACVLESLGQMHLSGISFTPSVPLTPGGSSHSAALDMGDAVGSSYSVLVGELERYLGRDKSFPSYHNVITTASLRAMVSLMLAGKTASDPDVFRRYLRPGNFEYVRREAARCLLRLAVYSGNQHVEGHDSSLSIEARHDCLRAVFESIVSCRADSPWLRNEVTKFAAIVLRDLPPNLHQKLFDFPLRKSIWLALNGPISAYDPRYRIHLISIHTLVTKQWKYHDGTWKLLPRRQPLPLLPTRPLPKSSDVVVETAKTKPDRTQQRQSVRATRTSQRPSLPRAPVSPIEVSAPLSQPNPPEPVATPSAVPVLKARIKLPAVMAASQTLTIAAPALSPRSPAEYPSSPYREPLSAPISPVRDLAPVSPPHAPMSPVVAPMSPVVAPAPPHVPHGSLKVSIAVPQAQPLAPVVINTGLGRLVFKVSAKPAAAAAFAQAPAQASTSVPKPVVSTAPTNPRPDIKKLYLSIGGLIYFSEDNFKMATKRADFGYEQYLSEQPRARAPRSKPKPARQKANPNDEYEVEEDDDDEFVPSHSGGPSRSRSSRSSSSKGNRKGSSRSRKRQRESDFIDDDDDDGEDVDLELEDDDEDPEAYIEEPEDADDFSVEDDEE